VITLPLNRHRPEFQPIAAAARLRRKRLTVIWQSTVMRDEEPMGRRLVNVICARS
jgi:hypothetical protein